MFHDYLARHPLGGVQHMAYRLKVEDFGKITEEIKAKGYKVISEVDHPIARMMFFDTYNMIGMATEIMGVTKEGWQAIEEMKGGGRG